MSVNIALHQTTLASAELERWDNKAMKTRHYFSGAALVASIVLTLIGIFKGAAVMVCLATVIELIASIVTGKKTNV